MGFEIEKLKIPAELFRVFELGEIIRAAGDKTNPDDPITFPAVLGSEEPAEQDMWDEVLLMSGLEEIPAEMPMLYDHNRSDLPVGCFREMRVDNRSNQLKGQGALTRTEGFFVGRQQKPDHVVVPQPIGALRSMVLNRQLRGLSMGYGIRSGGKKMPVFLKPGEELDGLKARGRMMLVARSWKLNEGSITPFPSDRNAGIRSASADPGRLTEIEVQMWRRSARLPVPDLKEKRMDLSELEKGLRELPADQVRAAVDKAHPSFAESCRDQGRTAEREYRKAFDEAIRAAAPADQEFYRSAYYGESLERVRGRVEADAKRIAQQNTGGRSVGETTGDVAGGTHERTASSNQQARSQPNPAVPPAEDMAALAASALGT